MVGEFASQKFSYEKEAMQKILDYLTANNMQAIETTQLQILCHNLEKKNLSTIGIANIPEFEDIFLQFYNDTITKIAPENQDKARKFVENELVKKGQRVSVSDLVYLDSVEKETLDILVGEHLLRPEYTTSTQRNNYELSHDTLLAPVLRAKSTRELKEKEQAERKAAQEARIAEEQRKEAERVAALAKAEAERIENAKIKKQVRVLSVAFGIAIVAMVTSGWLYYKTKVILQRQAELYISQIENAIEDKKTSKAYIDLNNLDNLDNSDEQVNKLLGKIILSDMVKVEGGEFMMGCTEKDTTACKDHEKPVHKVQLSNFEIGKYEVTQSLWLSVMEENPSYNEGCNNCPVENVSWDLIQEFLVKLKGKTGITFRLPTEAEWEYAAKGGKMSKNYTYAGSDSLDLVAWYRSNSDRETHPVGTKQPNELGLYDMSGNVWEWCDDSYEKNFYEICKNQGTVKNPNNKNRANSFRVLRGGSWDVNNEYSRVAYRYRDAPYDYYNYIGFRLVFSQY